MNSKAKGEITEGLFIGKLLSLGYVVLMPFGNNQRYDIVIETNGMFSRCQCKTARYRNGCIVFNTCSTNGIYGEDKTL